MLGLIIGIVILSLIFIGLFIACAMSVGFKEAVAIWLGSIGITALMVVAVYLIVSGYNG